MTYVGRLLTENEESHVSNPFGTNEGQAWSLDSIAESVERGCDILQSSESTLTIIAQGAAMMTEGCHGDGNRGGA